MTVHPYERPAASTRASVAAGHQPAGVATAGGLLFTAPRGTPLHYSSWLRRVWKPALRRAELDDPQPTPHDLRHTAITRWADGGLQVHELMALSGHDTLESVQRYLHAGEDRFDRARQAMKDAKRARGM